MTPEEYADKAISTPFVNDFRRILTELFRSAMSEARAEGVEAGRAEERMGSRPIEFRVNNIPFTPIPTEKLDKLASYQARANIKMEEAKIIADAINKVAFLESRIHELQEAVSALRLKSQEHGDAIAALGANQS